MSLNTPALLLALLIGLSCQKQSTKAPVSDSGTKVQSDSPDTDTDTVPEPDNTETAEPTPEPECENIHGSAPPLAMVNECNTLSYGLYSAHLETEAIHQLPDFSFAGYMNGGIPLPTVPVLVTVDPLDGDNKDQIQEAIHFVETVSPDENGHRGAVLLRSGTYSISDSLVIAQSGVVLRGEGQGEEGTILRATRPEQHNFIRVEGSGTGLGEVPNTRVPISSSVVPIGSTEFEVENADAFRVNDTIAVLRTPNQYWLDTLGMDEWGWTTSSFSVAHERRVTEINDTSIRVDVPLVDSIDSNLGGGAVYLCDIQGRIEQVGIENMRLVSDYTSDTDEEHGWIAVQFQRTTNSWVHNITAVNFGYSAVSLHNESNFNTIQNVAYLSPKSQVAGGRRYAFNVSGGVGNLFQRCYSELARHDFVSGSRTTGPNVWLDCLSLNSSNDDGPHHRWATGLLFDNIHSLELHVENRQDSGTGHGWSGAQTLFWNSTAENIICDTPQWSMNWTVGCMGEQTEGHWAPEEDSGWWESHGIPVEPRSLYLKQLESRLGDSAVQSITLTAQREGRIWGLLATWAGEGSLESLSTNIGDPECLDGIASGAACCSVECGSCGGTGCSDRPGGAEGCCVGTITTSGKSCDIQTAPCIISPPFGLIGE